MQIRVIITLRQIPLGHLQHARAFATRAMKSLMIISTLPLCMQMLLQDIVTAGTVSNISLSGRAKTNVSFTSFCGMYKHAECRYNTIFYSDTFVR
jgi:hypothetical protein